MWLENCLRAKPVIDFNPDTGEYRIVGKDELPDGTALVDISDKLYGDYLDESDEMHLKFGKGGSCGDKRFFVYWSIDRTRFYFQDSDGTRIEIDGRRYAELKDAVDVAGCAISGHMQFSIYEADGQLIYRHIYDQTPYLTAYMMDFSFPAPELADWDFFVALKGSFDYMRENAHKHHATASTEFVARVASGQRVPKSGWWFTPAEVGSRKRFKEGDVFPEVQSGSYGATFWQWSPDQSNPSLG